MNKFLEALKLFPSLLAGVGAVEQVAAAVPGPTRKQILVNTVVAAAKAGELVPDPRIALISTMIDEIVTQLNASGVFTHAAHAA